MVMNCALDGPAGAGKSTVAKEVAKKLGYVYVDTGALYRAIGLFATRCGAVTTEAAQVVPLLNSIDVKLKYEDGVQNVYLNGENVSDKIRTPEMSVAASNVSAIPKVREFLLDLQRNIAQNNDIIMDGRDIGTVILPDAQVKIFLIASAEERANRRFKELRLKGQDVNYDDVLNDIIKRDYNDSHRTTAPLKKADDAIEVDSSDMSANEVVDAIVQIILRKKELLDRPPLRNKPKFTVGYFFYSLARIIVNGFMHICFNITVEGLENIPHGGGRIIASNHVCWADVLLIGVFVKSPAAYVAKAELFKNKLVACILTIFHAFPVVRGSGNTDFITKSVKCLRKGRNLVIFPEGTRSKTGELGRPKTGVAHIAANSFAPVTPVSVRFEGKPKFRSKVTVSFGKTLTSDELFTKNMSVQEMHRIRDVIMDEIRKLNQK